MLASRTGEAVQLIPLDAQERFLWNAAMLQEGAAILKNALRRGRPGISQRRASISAVHSGAKSHRETRCHESALLHNGLQKRGGLSAGDGDWSQCERADPFAGEGRRPSGD
jgi:RNA polymerase sigma-70 factor, ECF subfamily